MRSSATLPRLIAGLWILCLSAGQIAGQTGQFPTQGLVAYYPFAGNANDGSGNGNHGIVHGALLTTDRFDVPHSAYHFDGQDAYIVSVKSIGIAGNAPRSVTAWLRILSFHEDESVVFWGDLSSTGAMCGAVWVSEPGHRLRFRGHYQDVDSPWTNLLKVGAWQQVAFTFDGTTGRVFVDGQQVGSSPLVLRTTDTPVSFGIGLNEERNIGLNRYYNGDLDDVRIYNRALSQAEIKAQLGAGGWTGTASPGSGSGGEVVSPAQGEQGAPQLSVTPAQVDLDSSVQEARLGLTNRGTGLLVWTVREGVPWLVVTSRQGSTLTDTSFSGVGDEELAVKAQMSDLGPGVYQARIRIQSNGGDAEVPVRLQVAEGQVNQGRALRLDGLKTYVEVPDSPSLHADSAITVEGWFKVDDFHVYWQPIYWKGNTVSTSRKENREYSLWVNSSGQLHLTSTPVDRIGIEQLSLDSPQGTIQAGQWYYFASVISSVQNRMEIYAPGERVASGAYSTAPIRHTTGPLRFGSTIGLDEASNQGSFKGLLDEVRLWNRALTQEEIRAHRQHSLTGDEGGLVGHWSFDRLDQDGLIPDLSGHGNRGVLMSGAGLVASDSPVGAAAPPDSVESDSTAGTNPAPDTSSFCILSIADVPNDRGRQVRIRWQRHPLDAAGARLQVVRYGVWRRFDPDLPSLRPKPAATAFGSYPEGEWTFVGEVPARGVEIYSYEAPTLADSTAYSGIYYSTFFVSAHTTATDSLYDCPPDSGYSVDNSIPAAPELFTGALVDGQVRLVWSPVPAGVAYYAVYRGSTADFHPPVIHQLVFVPRFTETYDPRQPFYCVAAVGITGTLGPFTRIAQIRPLAHRGPRPEDFDGDGQVGFADFFSLVDAIGSADSRFDLDGDGVVDLRDYLLFAAGFGGN